MFLGSLAWTRNAKCQGLHKNHVKILAANLKWEQEQQSEQFFPLEFALAQRSPPETRLHSMGLRCCDCHRNIILLTLALSHQFTTCLKGKDFKISASNKFQVVLLSVINLKTHLRAWSTATLHDSLEMIKDYSRHPLIRERNSWIELYDLGLKCAWSFLWSY